MISEPIYYAIKNVLTSGRIFCRQGSYPMMYFGHRAPVKTFTYWTGLTKIIFSIDRRKPRGFTTSLAVVDDGVPFTEGTVVTNRPVSFYTWLRFQIAVVKVNQKHRIVEVTEAAMGEMIKKGLI